MTQDLLSKIFNLNYPSFKEYSIKASKIMKGNPQIETLLSECYIYLDDKRHQLNDEADVVSWGKTWIKNNLRWGNSNYYKLENGRSNHIEFEDWDIPTTDTIDGDTIEKLMNTYYDKLNNHNKRLFSIYTLKGIRKGKDVATHLNISISGAYGIINECKEVEDKFKLWIISQI